MIAFYDKDTDLTFKCYSSEESTFDAFTNEYYSTIYQLNFWNDEGIKTFLTESTPLGNFLNWNNAFYSRQEKQKSQLKYLFL